MKIFKLMLLSVNIASFSTYLKAGPWSEKMEEVVKTLIVGETINIDKIFEQNNLKLIEKNWSIISGYTVSKNNYQGIAELLCSIFRVAHVKTTEDVFFVAKRILGKQTRGEKDYKGEFEYLLKIIQQKAGTIDQGLHAFKKAQEAVTYYNDNGEWPYDDYVGGYTVEDFLNEEEAVSEEDFSEENKDNEKDKLLGNNVIEGSSSEPLNQDHIVVETPNAMSVINSSSEMNTPQMTSPEKENPQSRIPDLPSKGLMEMDD